MPTCYSLAYDDVTPFSLLFLVLVGGALTDGGALIAWLDGLIGPEKIQLAQEKLIEVLATQDEGFLETAPMMLPFFR